MGGTIFLTLLQGEMSLLYRPVLLSCHAISYTHLHKLNGLTTYLKKKNGI